jgi:hypothetical protein
MTSLLPTGLVRMEPGYRMPPGACSLCLPKSDRDLMDRPCDEMSLNQVKPKVGLDVRTLSRVLAVEPGRSAYHMTFVSVEIKSRSNSGNACHHSVKNLLSFHLI